MADMAVAIVMEMELEETAFLQEEAVTEEAINKEVLTKVRVNLEAILINLYLWVIWHSKRMIKK